MESSSGLRSSLNDLPSIDFDLVKERGFILLLTLILGPRVATSAFVKNVPSNPLSSSSTRSALATPFDIQSSGRGRSPCRTPPVVGPNSISLSSTPTGHVDPSSKTPVIEVETFPEGDTTTAPSSPSFVPSFEVGSSSQKRPHIEEVPQVEEVPPSGPTQAAASAYFPLPVMTPQFNPKAGYLTCARGSYPSGVFWKQLADEESKFQGEISLLKTQLEEKDRQISVQAMEMESLRTTSLQSYSRGCEEGLQAGHSAVVATYKASPEYADEVFRYGSSFYVDGFTVCAEQFKNLHNLPPNFDLI
ncbi:hypothetical protein Salat_2122500 [Sesamum alatum]|uniref:Uncharacterized protein n=1 Tax=Sesamum alatum TaxID=300844 RepID=A0AAE1Y141_9LAMI|nr:hypothetical protein Salat_2122500 [Sesamum alatum]